jgi:hypothetical protein
MLIIPMNNSIVGAVFPISGIPEFPKSSASMKPVLMNQLQRIPPDQRSQILGTWIRQKQAQHAQQQKQAEHQQMLQQMQISQMDASSVGGGGPYTFPPNLSMDMPSTGSNMNPLTMFGVPQQPMSGGGMGNVSLEMMQSFMQRNANEGGAGMGPS